MNETPKQNAAMQLANVTNLVDTSGLEKTKAQTVLDQFQTFFEEASTWENKVKAIAILNKRQHDVVTPAREARLALKDVRVRAEKTKKALKENILIEGRFIDAIYNTIVAVTQPLETKLLETEKWQELEEEKRKAELKAKRLEEISPYGADTTFTDLSAMTEEAYQMYLETAKLAHAKRLEAQKQAEEDIRAKQEAEAKERERIKAENEKLQKERAEQEAKLKAEAEARSKAEAELQEKRRQEQEAKAKADADAKAKAEAEERARQAPDTEKIKVFLQEVQKTFKERTPELATDAMRKRLDVYKSEVYALTLEILNEIT